MNLHPDFGDEDSHPPLAPPEWTMDVRNEVVGDSRRHTAIIKRAGTPICHLSIGPVAGGDEGAREALAIKARLWVAEYLNRDHAGDTDYMGLGDG